MLPQSLNKQGRIQELKQLYVAYSEDRNLVNTDWQEFVDDLAPDACSFLSDLEIESQSNFVIRKDINLYNF